MSETLEEFYGYYVCFDATGVKEIDDVLSAVANACRASHHTDGWRDDHFNDGETCEKKIQDAANKSAATLTARESELAEAQRRISSIAKSQLNACTTECIDGIWWAKGSGIVAGPQATERDALLEVAENWWRVAEKRESELAEAKRRVAELEAEVQRVTRNCQHNLDGKREQERLKKLYLKQLREACGIIHIPGKESDDGEMH